MSTPQNRSHYLRSGKASTKQAETSNSASGSSAREASLSILPSPLPVRNNQPEGADRIVLDPAPRAMAHINLQMLLFYGKPGERASQWLQWFENLATVNKIADQNRVRTLPFYLKDHALAWFNSQPAEVTSDYNSLTAALKTRFNGNDGLDTDYLLQTVQQGSNESVPDYFTRILSLTAQSDLGERYIKDAALRGLSKDLIRIVMPQNPKTLEELRQVAILAEQTLSATSEANVSVVNSDGGKMDELIELLKCTVQLQQQQMQQQQVFPQQFHQQHQQPQFEVDQPPFPLVTGPLQTYSRGKRSKFQQQQQNHQQQQQQPQHNHGWQQQHPQRRQQQQLPQQQQQYRHQSKGRTFHHKQNFPVNSNECFLCRKPGHKAFSCSLSRKNRI